MNTVRCRLSSYVQQSEVFFTVYIKQPAHASEHYQKVNIVRILINTI